MSHLKRVLRFFTPEVGICLNCLGCTKVCSQGLAPNILVHLCQAEQYERSMELGLLRCNECGNCEKQCPAHISILAEFTRAKARLGLCDSSSVVEQIST